MRPDCTLGPLQLLGLSHPVVRAAAIDRLHVAFLAPGGVRQNGNVGPNGAECFMPATAAEQHAAASLCNSTALGSGLSQQWFSSECIKLNGIGFSQGKLANARCPAAASAAWAASARRSSGRRVSHLLVVIALWLPA